MKELIIALQACLQLAVTSSDISGEQCRLIREHVQSLQDLTLRNDAIAHLKAVMEGNYIITSTTAAGALAKVCLMLATYGSKPDAILAVIHDKGWPEVTLADVEAVRNFILQQ